LYFRFYAPTFAPFADGQFQAEETIMLGSVKGGKQSHERREQKEIESSLAAEQRQ
jgi:hypothetical protein